MFDMKQVGKQIADLRKENNMTQMELADKMGVSFQAVSNWERGNTMPDISKLPELAEIFHISVDELLIVKGKVTLVSAVLDDTIAAYIEEGKATEQEIADTLPILKPEQAKKILEKADISQFHDISSFLPFIDSDALVEIAIEYVENGNSVDELLPFLDENDVARLAIKALERGDSINNYLPFMDEDDLNELAIKALERGDSIGGYLPFVDEDTVNELAIKALERGDSIDEYLPFMDEDDVTQLVLKILRSKKK